MYVCAYCIFSIDVQQDRPMVLAVGKDDERNVFRSSFPDGPLFKGPLMLLTDGLSASASEVIDDGATF